eukprot:12731596-Ditylum_brightwellii.AAC.1
METHGRQQDSHSLQSNDAINMKNGTRSAMHFTQIEDTSLKINPPITISPRLRTFKTHNSSLQL